MTEDKNIDEPKEVAPDEGQYRRLLRAVTIGVILFLLIFRVFILPLIQLASHTDIRDDGYVLGTLIGALLLLLGIEAPSFISGLGGKK